MQKLDSVRPETSWMNINGERVGNDLRPRGMPHCADDAPVRARAHHLHTSIFSRWAGDVRVFGVRGWAGRNRGCPESRPTCSNLMSKDKSRWAGGSLGVACVHRWAGRARWKQQELDAATEDCNRKQPNMG